MADFRTPLAKARGLGSAKSGVGHFIAQRVSALALVILVPLFVWAVASLPGADYASAYAFVGSPYGAILTLLTLTAALYHMRLGLQVVIEDYIHKPMSKALLLIANTLICAGLSLNTRIRSASVAASRTLWVTINAVVGLDCHSSSSNCRKRCAVDSSRDTNGSSRISNSGSRTNARARLARLANPRES